MSKSAVAVPKPLPLNPTPSATDKVRALPFASVHEMVSPPADYGQMSAEDKRGLLKLDESYRAELRDGLGEISSKRNELVHDLGRFAPSSEVAESLREQLAASHAARVRAHHIAAFCTDKEDVVNHDALSFVNRIASKLKDLALDDPSVAQRYPALMGWVTQRRDAIVEGMARAREERAAKKEGTQDK